jgi:hypothetical protein
MLGIIDKVDLVAISDLESPTRCGDLDYAESAVDCRDEDFLAGWLDGLVLKYRRMRPRWEKKGGSRKESVPD